MSNRRASAALRGTSAASVATFVALLSHVSGGGELPGLIGIVVPLVLSTLVCVALAGRRLSVIRLACAVGISQFLFHALFVLGVSGSQAGGAGSAAPHHAHGAVLTLDAAAAPMLHSSGSGVAMWIAHACAALATTAALHRAESVLGALGALTRFVLARLLPTAVTAVPVALAPARILPQRPARSPLPLGVALHAIARRGPPICAAA